MSGKFSKSITSKRNTRSRALLDTNIWRYVVDDGSEGALKRIDASRAVRLWSRQASSEP